MSMSQHLKIMKKKNDEGEKTTEHYQHYQNQFNGAGDRLCSRQNRDVV